ncbi:hypothetical protein B8W99_21440 [Peribacillus simplex]|nr:hypothetical protein B8W99_21440 [Peribacillus simplex]
MCKTESLDNIQYRIYTEKSKLSRIIRELRLQEPLHGECAKYYMYELLRKVINPPLFRPKKAIWKNSKSTFLIGLLFGFFI